MTKKQSNKTSFLPRSFYDRDTALVAKELLGKKLCRRLPSGEILSGYIVETEAYVGIKDKACHAFGGRRTKRTEVMYAEAGVAYIYLIYGMYYCLNIVTREAGTPEAVLIRALEPVDGLAVMQDKSRQDNPHKILNGPGKLCKVLGIEKSLNHHPVDRPPLWIEEGFQVPAKEIIKSARINIDYANEWAAKPLRFTIQDSPFISVKAAKTRRTK